MASLEDLGLSEYEARAYRSLLKTGSATANDLSQVSDVPMGRIYDVMNSLEQNDLVRSRSDARPKTYVAVAPDMALDRLLATKKRELDEQADRYESIVDELTDDLETAEPLEETFWTTAVGPNEAVDLLVERLSACDTQVSMVLSAYTQHFFDLDEIGTLVLEELTAAMHRGVEIRLLVRPDLVSAFPDQILDRYQESLTDDDRFSVRTSENVSGIFTLLDSSEVLIEVPHPLKNDAIFATIDLKDRELTDRVQTEFEPRWKEATELSL